MLGRKKGRMFVEGKDWIGVTITSVYALDIQLYFLHASAVCFVALQVLLNAHPFQEHNPMEKFIQWLKLTGRNTLLSQELDLMFH